MSIHGKHIGRTVYSARTPDWKLNQSTRLMITVKNHCSVSLLLAVATLCLAQMTLSAQNTNDTPPPWLDARLEWFEDQKFGLLMHWGSYSQLGVDASWPIVPDNTGGRTDAMLAWLASGRNYEQFKKNYLAAAKTFNPTNFNPDEWARAAKQAGMKYVVFTTKHHDGYCMFDTAGTDFRVTAPDCAFHNNARSNIVREVFNSFRQQGFGIGAYFSKADWHSPYYWNPQWPANTMTVNYDTHAHPEIWSNFVAFTYAQIKEMMTGYGRIDILWLDAGWVRPPDEDLQMDKVAAMARHYQPHLIMVDRTVGGKYENYRTPEQEVPDKPLPYPWETCMTMGTQWAWKPNDDYKSSFQLVQLLVDIVGKGGNFLLNVGPRPDGKLPSAALQRMHDIGNWLKLNGQAIYGTRPIAPYKDDRVVYTHNGNIVYAIYLPENPQAGLPERIYLAGLKPAPGSQIHLLGVQRGLKWKTLANGTTAIEIPNKLHKSPPGHYAFAFKFQPAAAE